MNSLIANLHGMILVTMCGNKTSVSKQRLRFEEVDGYGFRVIGCLY